MNRLSRNNFSLRTSDGDYEDEEQLYDRQALILENNYDICDNQINIGQVRVRQQSDREIQRDISKVYELKSFNNRPYRDDYKESNSIAFTYYEIQPNDSLQNICLRYACPISHVKRLNRLMSDQDFYGLKRLKLPLGKLGLLDDLLKQNNNGSQDLLVLSETGANQSTSRLVNSPGAASSVLNRQNNSGSEPLFIPSYPLDRINGLNGPFQNEHRDIGGWTESRNGYASRMHNSHSFSSLRNSTDGDTSININNSESIHPTTSNTVRLPEHSLIKTDMTSDPSQMTIDNLLTNNRSVVANVFEDLDYHVKQAKAAAENYDQRAAELVSGIESNMGPGQASYLDPRPGNIPEIFAGANFDLDIKILVMLIFFICLVVPLIYLSQAIQKDDHGS